jgi:hypothetical protein
VSDSIISEPPEPLSGDVAIPDWMKTLPPHLRAKYVQAMLGVKEQVKTQIALGLAEADIIRQDAASQATTEAETQRCHDLAFEVDALYEFIDLISTDLVQMRMDYFHYIEPEHPGYQQVWDEEWALLEKEQKWVFDKRRAYVQKAKQHAKKTTTKEEE